MNIYTIKKFAQEIHRSHEFVRFGIKHGKMEAKKIGGVWLIPSSEVERFKQNPFQISRKETVL